MFTSQTAPPSVLVIRQPGVFDLRDPLTFRRCPPADANDFTTDLCAESEAVMTVGVGDDLALGRLSGAQTQPAALAFAAERTGDPQLDLTCALVPPAAMVTKIPAAQLLILI